MELPIFIYVAILFLAALLSTRIMKLLKLPNVTGYIITGIIMGPFVFGLFFNNFDFSTIKTSPLYSELGQLSWVSEIALGFIAFSIGTSFKASTLKAVGNKVVIITIFEALGASLLVTLILVVAHFISPETVSLPLALSLGAISSATAPAATLMVIKQYKARGELVNTLLPVVALDDAAALILFAVLFQIATAIGGGGEFSLYKMLAKPLIEIILSLGFGAVFGIFISWINKFFKSRNNRLVLAIFVVFASVGLYKLFTLPYMGEFELSSLLMCMMAAAIYTNMAKDNNKTLDQLDRLTYPVYMMFFVISGASLDLSIFASSDGLIVILIALIYVLVRVAGKYVGAFTGAVITKSDSTVKKYLGLTLIPQAGVAIGLATTANRIFINSDIPEVVRTGQMILAIILTSTLIYELVGPLISKYALKKAGNIIEE